MATYRAGTDWRDAIWPTATTGTADTTTWSYHEPTGLLVSKTDASGKSVAYTYTQAGQIATRTWARSIVTTYAYSATTAELTGVTYSDGTPALGYTYNRLGNQATVTDVTGTRTFNYNLGSTLEMQGPH
jgi:YD repeat-containing protein